MTDKEEEGGEGEEGVPSLKGLGGIWCCFPSTHVLGYDCAALRAVGLISFARLAGCEEGHPARPATVSHTFERRECVGTRGRSPPSG